MSEVSTIVPPEFAGFDAHARQGRLAFPCCEVCGQFHWYPMPRCPHCRCERIKWRPIAGRGEVFSYTFVHHAFDRSRAGALPYIVALVTFPDAPGVRLISNVVGADASQITIGAAVAPLFRPSEAGEQLVLFTLSK